jgi:hypothetical protein
MANAACHAGEYRLLKGEDSITIFRSPFPRRFCRHCSSPVPCSVEGTDYVIVQVSTLDGDPVSRPSHHIFVSSNACWFEITDGLPRYDEYAPSAPDW